MVDPRLCEGGWQSCVLFTYCRQQSATFSSHFHTTWGHPFRDSLYSYIFQIHYHIHAQWNNCLITVGSYLAITWQFGKNFLWKQTLTNLTLIRILHLSIGNRRTVFPSRKLLFGTCCRCHVPFRVTRVVPLSKGGRRGTPRERWGNPHEEGIHYLSFNQRICKNRDQCT